MPFHLAHQKEQQDFGACLGRACNNKSSVIYLQGEIGAGKTTLARGFIQSLGFTGKIKSPSYSLIETYFCQQNQQKMIFHVDLYRLQTAEEVLMLGLKDNFFLQDCTLNMLIEWPERAFDALPSPDITCYIAAFEDHRVCQLETHTPAGEEVLVHVKQKWMKK